MKKTNIIIFLILLMAFLSSCYDDKGNYDYNWVPEVGIEMGAGGFRDTTIKRGQRLKIEPNLDIWVKSEDGTKNKAAFRPEEFSYKWTAYLNSIKDPITVLGTTQNLDTTINLSLQSRAYRVVYSVIEKVSGVTWNFSFNLTVENRYENAWLFLTEDDHGETDMTLYGKELGNESEDPWVFEYNVLERSGFPYRGKGAKFIYYHSKNSRIYIGTGESAGWIGKNDLDWNDKQMIRYKMASMPPVDFAFEGIQQASALHFIASNGNIYPMTNGDIIMSAYNILPPGITGTGKYETVQLAPFVGGIGSSATCVVYDETHKRMLSYRASTGNPDLNAKLISGASRLPNHKLYFMQGFVPDKAYVLVIAKNLENNKYYKYIYYGGALQSGSTVEIINGSLLDEAEGSLDRTKQYVCDYSKGNFYMAYGNKLYVLNGNTLQEVTISDPENKVPAGFAGLDPICLLTRYSDIQSTRSNIMVATYRAGTDKSGKVYFLEPNSVAPWEMTVKTYYDNMDRVKGISRF